LENKENAGTTLLFEDSLPDWYDGKRRSETLVKQTSTLQFLFLNLTSPFFLGFQGHCPRQAESVRTDSLLVKTMPLNPWFRLLRHF
jgi:hypothetical protein